MKITKLLKILGFLFLAVGITLVVLGTTVFTDSTFMGMPNVAMLIPGVMLISLSFITIMYGFAPELTKLRSKFSHEVYNEAGKDISSVQKRTAEIESEAIKTKAKAMREGFTKEERYCANCGKKIEKDSKFCKFCGKEQQ